MTSSTAFRRAVMTMTALLAAVVLLALLGAALQPSAAYAAPDNGAQGTVVIKKVTVPSGAGGDFNFSTNVSGTESFDLADGESMTLTVPAPAKVVVTETQKAGWQLRSLVCSPIGRPNAGSGTVTVNVVSGTLTVCIFENYQLPEPPSPPYYVSPWTNGIIPSDTGQAEIEFYHHDILKWDGDEWTKWFDGAAAGLDMSRRFKHNIYSLWVSGTVVVSETEQPVFVASFAQNHRIVPGIAEKVHGTDLVLYDGTGFSLFFDGSDVGLNSLTQEKIDGMHVLYNGVGRADGCLAYLLISTWGPGMVPAPDFARAKPVIKFRGEDILGFCATNLGEDTAGTWEMVMDGSAMFPPLQKNAVDSITANEDGTLIYATVNRKFPLRSQIFIYDLENNTATGPYFNFADEAVGLESAVDALDFGPVER